MSEPVPEPELLSVALEAARAAAAELLSRFRGELAAVRTKSTDTDPVSEADVAAEQAIRRVLARRRPGDAILGEEGGLTEAGRDAEPTGLRWVVDPLDGTVNYLYGIPTFAVSVAVEDGDGAVAGVVLNPVSGEIFSATRSGPVRLTTPEGGQVPLSPRGETRLGHALVATGFGYDAAVRALQGQVLAGLLARVRDVRRAGAAALDLCSVAAGRADAYYERGVKPWDIAAGVLICQRVGLVARRLEAVPAGARSPDSAGLPLGGRLPGSAGLPGGGRSPGSGALPEGIVVAPAELIDELYALVSGPSL